jgi:hypothetical protein
VATGTEVLDAGRRDHVVLFYRDEQELTERVTRYLLPAIQDGGVAITVATPDHRRPDPAGFWQAVSPVLRQAAKAGRPVRVFGEMVALLWQAGLTDAAVEVEAMWNELGAQYPFSLLCAYPAQPAGLRPPA